MKTNATQARSGRKTALWYLYLVSGILLAFTGFGQMPIYKRYYISDIPGLAWAADFYSTHLLHYLFSALLFGIAAYVVINHVLLNRKRFAVTTSGYVRAAIIAGLSVTGIFLVIYNFSGVTFPAWAATALLVGHMVLAMALMITGLVVLIGRKPWVKAR